MPLSRQEKNERQRLYRLRTLERRLECEAEYRAKRKLDPEWVERQRESKRRYARATPDKQRERLRKHREENKEYWRAMSRVQYAKHRERRLEEEREKRANMGLPEKQRRAERLREWRERNPEKAALAWARSIIAQGVGMPQSEVPQGLAEAKAMQLLVRRAAR
jgi:hypothetical protein